MPGKTARSSNLELLRILCMLLIIGDHLTGQSGIADYTTLPSSFAFCLIGCGSRIACSVFILIGAAIISRFTWVFFLFGAFLIVTAIKLVTGGDEDEEYHENGLIRALRKVIKITDEYDGEKLRTVKNGAKYWTPMLIVFLTIGTTDVMFAFDSIPAIFGLTKDPFIVFTSNVFALLGLQQLYFLLGELLDKLVYLPLGLSVVLGFIGVKLIMEALHGNSLPFINGGQPIAWVPEVPTWLSLAVIVVAIGGAALASVLKMRAIEAKEK